MQKRKNDEYSKTLLTKGKISINIGKLIIGNYLSKNGYYAKS